MKSDMPSTNAWDYKPWWCQPWSILLTGSCAIAGGWFLTRSVAVTLVISGPIALWWGYFLLLWPRAVARALSAEAAAEKHD